MTKYNSLFKQQVIEFYLQNGKNRSLTSKHFQLADRTLQCWIKQFNHNGINGLAVLGKKRHYSPEFKLNVVQAVKNGQFSAERLVYTLALPIQQPSVNGCKPLTNKV